MKRLILLLSIFVLDHHASLHAAAGTDTLQVMTLEDYYRIILTRHPVVRQTSTFTADAQAQIRMQRGLLDPTLNVNYQGKALSGTQYYQLWDNTLKIPVWFGTDFKVGYENNDGVYLNPENQTPDPGLWYAGVSIPLGQGLFIDERRKTIQQARLLPSLAEADRISTINNILLKATNDYWDWYHAWQRYQLLDSAYLLAANRFEAIKARAALGELPWIDTVEAKIAVLDREMLLVQAQTELSNAMLQASVHLWGENETPLELSANVVPQMDIALLRPIPSANLDSLIAESMRNHPDLVRLDVQLRVNAIEERNQRDQFKPKFSFEYNFLTKSLNGMQSPVYGNYYRNNYKIGVQFSYPLLLRKERGKLQRIEIKQLQLTANLQQKQREIVTGIRINHTNWIMLQSQMTTQMQQLTFQRELRDAEQFRFFAGESSFFLVNTREMTLINSELRLYELQVRAAKTKAMLYWSSGTPLAN